MVDPRLDLSCAGMEESCLGSFFVMRARPLECYISALAGADRSEKGRQHGL